MESKPSTRSPVPTAIDDAGPICSSLPTSDPEIREIVSQFLGRLDKKTQAMREACDAQDYETLRELSHWLKGSGGMVGFACLTDAARNLEVAAKSEQRIEADRILRKIENLVSRVTI